MSRPRINLSPTQVTIISFMVIFFTYVGSSYAYQQIKSSRESAVEKTIPEIIQEDAVNNKVGAPVIKDTNISQDLIQKCPDAWYDNQMPRVVREGEVVGTREYLIIDGKRVELSQVDMDWIVQNCQIRKQTVY